MTTPFSSSAELPLSSNPLLESAYAPISEELRGARRLYRETILDSKEQRHLHDLLIGDKTLPAPNGLRVEIVDQIFRHLLQTEGKWHRAAMTLLSAAAWDRRDTPVLQAAVAVELVHLATLVHDDIIDEADMRRGQKSVRSGWGNSVAVLIGDFLFCKAFKLLLSSGSVPTQTALTVATGQMCLGEISQLRQVHQFQTTEQEYLETIAHKTAALMAAAAVSGGYLAGMDEDICGRLDHLGYSLGMAFQITDDLLDYRSSVAETGKDSEGDLRSGKLTLPLIHLIDKVPAARELARKSVDDSDSREKLRTLLEENGAYDYALGLANRNLDEAREDLRQLRKRGGAADCLDAFERFLEFIYSRVQ